MQDENARRIPLPYSRTAVQPYSRAGFTGFMGFTGFTDFNEEVPP
ncbi:hypothetical protein AB0L42_19010 [Streptomyces sp. NPDC052287]